MSKSKFETSKESGVHSQLLALVGNWKGMAKTWFEPDVLADEPEMTGTIKPILGGRFLLHEYNGTMEGKPFEGMAIYGFDISNNRYECAWVDSFHMSTGIMFSKGVAGGEKFSVLGSYGGPEMPEPWGWRTTVELVSDDEFIITAYNITPEGVEAKATETLYRRT